MKPITMRKFRGYFFLAVSAILLGSCAGLPSNLDALKSRESAAQPIDAKTAARYALYGMMAANAYHDPSPIHFPLERLGWELVDLNGNGTDKPSFEDECLPYGTGLAYDIYRHSDGKRVVFAFRGTDDPVCDWTMANLAWISAAQYDKAERHFNDYLAAHLDSRVVMLTGHSLGGGLALSQSIRHGIEAAAFDSSPNANSLLLDKPIRPAERVLIYQKGEILEKPRDAAMPAGFSKIVPEENVYETKYDFGKMDLLSSNPVYLHSSGPLALGLLRQGAKIDPDLEGFCKAIGCRDKALLETAPVITANPIDLSLFNRIALASLSASERKDPQGDFRIAEHLEGETQCLASGEAGSTPPGWDG
ncbi:MAG: Mbeg1-like protein, partial [Gammaproteobacteria bacterium]